MSEEDSQNLRDIKLLLQEINEKTSVYLRVKMMLEGEYGEKREARHEHASRTQQDFWDIDDKFRLMEKNNG